jgi:hypothetical protein
VQERVVVFAAIIDAARPFHERAISTWVQYTQTSKARIFQLYNSFARGKVPSLWAICCGVSRGAAVNASIRRRFLRYLSLPRRRRFLLRRRCLRSCSRECCTFPRRSGSSGVAATSTAAKAATASRHGASAAKAASARRVGRWTRILSLRVVLIAEESGQFAVHKFDEFLHGRQPRSIPRLSATPAQPGDDSFFIHLCL